MKKISLIIAVVVILISIGSALASGSLPGNGWWSGEQIQNIGENSADVTINAYDASSSDIYTATKTIDAGSSQTWLPGHFPGMGSDFMGSAIVTSEEPIRAITNVTNRYSEPLGLGVPGGLAAAQYQGLYIVDNTAMFPVAKNDYNSNTTTFYIQNASNQAAPAYATFYAGGSTYSFTTPSIDPGKMVVVSPSDAAMPSGDVDGFGAVIFTSTQQIAGAVMEHKTVENPSTHLGGTRGFIPDDSSDQLFAPIIKNDFGNRYTSIYVMNTNSVGNVDITITYNKVKRCGEDPGPWVDTVTGLTPGAAVEINHITGETNLPEGTNGCLATATLDVTGGGAVAIIKEAFTATYIGAGNDDAIVYYSALASEDGTTKVSTPLYKEYSRGKYSGLQIQNIGVVSATNVVATFSGSGGTFTTVPQEIGPGDGMTLLNMINNKDASFWDGPAMTKAALGCDPDCKANGIFGVTITSDQNIIAIVNESPFPFAVELVEQDKNNYEGFNLIP